MIINSSTYSTALGLYIVDWNRQTVIDYDKLVETDLPLTYYRYQVRGLSSSEPSELLQKCEDAEEIENIDILEYTIGNGWPVSVTAERVATTDGEMWDVTCEILVITDWETIETEATGTFDLTINYQLGSTGTANISGENIPLDDGILGETSFLNPGDYVYIFKEGNAIKLYSLDYYLTYSPPGILLFSGYVTDSELGQEERTNMDGTKTMVNYCRINCADASKVLSERYLVGPYFFPGQNNYTEPYNSEHSISVKEVAEACFNLAHLPTTTGIFTKSALEILQYYNQGIDISPDGTYLAITFQGSPYIKIFKKSGESYIQLSNPDVLPSGSAQSCAFSPDNTYLAVAHDSSPYITIYKRSGDTFTKLSNPDVLPTGVGWSCAFSPDNTYLAVGSYGSPHLQIYKRSGDTFTKLTDPGTLPSGTVYDCAFSSDNTYLAVSQLTSPYISIYKRSGDTFTKLSDPTTLPTGLCNGCAFSPDNTYLAVTSDSPPYLLIYKRSGDTFTKLENPQILPSFGTKCAFSPDGSYLAVGGYFGKGLIAYYRSGDTFSPIYIDNYSGIVGLSYSPDGNYIVAINGGHYLLIYERFGGPPFSERPPYIEFSGLPTTYGFHSGNQGEKTWVISMTPLSEIVDTIYQITRIYCWADPYGTIHFGGGGGSPSGLTYKSTSTSDRNYRPTIKGFGGYGYFPGRFWGQTEYRRAQGMAGTGKEPIGYFIEESITTDEEIQEACNFIWEQCKENYYQDTYTGKIMNIISSDYNCVITPGGNILSINIRVTNSSIPELPQLVGGQWKDEVTVVIGRPHE